MVTTITTVLFFFFALPRVLSVLEDFTSLSCGSMASTTYTDEFTGIPYVSDAPYIDTGIGRQIKSIYQRKVDENQWELRSFPIGSRNCYTFRLKSGDRYLVRAGFLHGGYDDNAKTQFQLHIGANQWATISTENETDTKYVEISHQLTSDRLQVCLVKTGDSTPFITTLELRKLNSEAYKDKRGSLQTLMRADVGSLSKQSLRYRADVFDRIWQPYNSNDWTSITTNNSVGIKNPFITASFPTDPDSPMTIRLTSGVDWGSILYLVMHFSEIQELRKNETREFAIKYNGRLIQDPFRPPSLLTRSIYFDEEDGPNENGEYVFSLEKTENSTLPPLLNAIEVFLVKKLPL